MPRPPALDCSPLEPREVPAAGMFADVMPGVWGSYPRDITPAGNTLFFSAEDRAAGRELWATDGTTAGTHLVKDIAPGRNGSNPTGLLADGNGGIYFTADAGTGPTLWHSDGTAAGTVNLGLKNTGGMLPARNGVLFLMADGGQGHGNVLWRTDGTAAGTAPVTGVPDALRFFQTTPPPSATGSILAHFGWDTTGWKGELYFVTQDLTTGQLTWAKTNGTSTTTLTDFAGTAGTAVGVDPSVRVVGDRLEMSLLTTTGEPMVWQTDGTPAGTQLLEQDVTVSSSATGTVPLASGVEISPGKFVYATSNSSGASLWVGDGHTAASFQLLQSIPGGLIPSIRLAGGKAYFTVQQSGSASLWASDGTPAGTHKIDAMSAVMVDPIAGLIGGKAVVQQSFFGGRYWLTDGTNAGTTTLPVPPGTENVAWHLVGSVPADAANPNGFLLFQEPQGGKVYRTDGTAAGTALVDMTGMPAHQIYSVPISGWSLGSSGVTLNGLDAAHRDGVGVGAYFKGAVYYSGKTDVQRAELWRWDLAGQATTPTPAPAPTIKGTQVNDGSAQRSMVKTLTVTFDSAVTVNPAGVTILNARGDTPAFTQQLTTANGKTTLTVSFPAGVGGSIADGRWTLRIDDTAVTGKAGGTKMASDYAFVFTRVYGDTGGDGIYDRDTRLRVHALLGHHTGDTGFDPALDWNSDGVIDGVDELAAVRNWGKSV